MTALESRIEGDEICVKGADCRQSQTQGGDQMVRARTSMLIQGGDTTRSDVRLGAAERRVSLCGRVGGTSTKLFTSG